jgi:hypothetical protein
MKEKYALNGYFLSITFDSPWGISKDFLISIHYSTDIHDNRRVHLWLNPKIIRKSAMN